MKKIKFIIICLLVFIVTYLSLLKTDYYENEFSKFSKLNKFSLNLNMNRNPSLKNADEDKENFLAAFESIKNEFMIIGVDYEGETIFFTNDIKKICQKMTLLKGKCEFPLTNIKGENIIFRPNRKIVHYEELNFSKIRKLLEDNMGVMVIISSDSLSKIDKNINFNKSILAESEKSPFDEFAFMFKQVNQKSLILIPLISLILIGLQEMMRNEKELKIKQLYGKNLFSQVFKILFKDFKEIIIYTIGSLFIIGIFFNFYLNIFYLFQFIKILYLEYFIILVIYFLIIFGSYAFVFYSDTTEILKNKLNFLRFIAINTLVFIIIFSISANVFKNSSFIRPLNFLEGLEYLDTDYYLYKEHYQKSNEKAIYELNNGIDLNNVRVLGIFDVAGKTVDIYDNELYEHFYKEKFTKYPVLITDDVNVDISFLKDRMLADDSVLNIVKSKNENNFLIVDKKDLKNYKSSFMQNVRFKGKLNEAFRIKTISRKFYIYTEIFILSIIMFMYSLNSFLFYKYYIEYFQKEIKIKKIFSKKYFLLNKVLISRIIVIIGLLFVVNAWSTTIILFYTITEILINLYYSNKILRRTNND